MIDNMQVIDTTRVPEVARKTVTPPQDNFWVFDNSKNQVEVIMKSKKKKRGNNTKASRVPINIKSIDEDQVQEPNIKKQKTKSIFSYTDHLAGYFETPKAKQQPEDESDAPAWQLTAPTYDVSEKQPQEKSNPSSKSGTPPHAQPSVEHMDQETQREQK